MGVSEDNGKFWNVSLGQGQETKAMESLNKAFEQGGWVILNVRFCCCCFFCCFFFLSLLFSDAPSSYSVVVPLSRNRTFT